MSDGPSVLSTLVEAATADSEVVGLVLTGSHARGLATPSSDCDVIVVVHSKRGRWAASRRTPELDEIVVTVEELADTAQQWQRYAFRGAHVLLDRASGQIADLVAAQATPTPTEAETWGRAALDGYLNHSYRAAKSRRDGHLLEARLDEVESVGLLLTAVFAMHGRLRPYNKYLRWELEHHPLGPPWNDEVFPHRAAADPSSYVIELERLARRCGHGDVVDAWGDDMSLRRSRAREALNGLAK